ncbi:MAG TPA: ribosome-binding factor A, partial [Candidatus Paceibacterota bacterium]|nr:ribosome-binding factor A [Candidatus Paceibacterota bacterium]
QKLAAEFIEKNSNGKSMITVTAIDLSPDMKEAKVLFTVLPSSAEDAAEDFLKRQRSDFRDYVKKVWRMRTIPFFDFELDKGERHRQRIDELLSQAKQADELKK